MATFLVTLPDDKVSADQVLIALAQGLCDEDVRLHTIAQWRVPDEVVQHSRLGLTVRKIRGGT